MARMGYSRKWWESGPNIRGFIRLPVLPNPSAGCRENLPELRLFPKSLRRVQVSGLANGADSIESSIRLEALQLRSVLHEPDTAVAWLTNGYQQPQDQQ